jgi:hypothetical protein
MFMVAPNGNTKPQTDSRTPSSECARRIDVGNVALLDEVENAVTIMGMALRKNSIGLRPANQRSSIG